MVLEISNMLLIFCIIIFTIVQSVFGVGILIFGTPTLLLLGYSFPETLSYLLPSSIIVSFFQIHNRWNKITLYKFNVIFFILPSVIFGLLVVIYVTNINLHLVVGLMLLVTSLTRLSVPFNNKIEVFFSNNFRLGFLFTGFIHGLTNLGGAPLLIITNGIYKDKTKVQPNTAYAYFFMALIQFLVLILSKTFVFSYIVVILPFISGIIFLYMGRFLFEITNDKLFFNIMTFFIFLYGLILVIK